MTAGGSSIPEVQVLLRVLAGRCRRAGEAGTAFGEGAPPAKTDPLVLELVEPILATRGR